jgi:hypothetical protein
MKGDVMRLLLILAAIFAVSIAMMAHALADDGIREAIVREAQAQGVDPVLALAVAKVESNFDPMAIGAIGEVGIFQLRPEFFDIEHGDVKGNIELGVANLKRVQALCGPKYGDAFYVCHNTGTNKKLVEPRKAPYFQKVERAKREMAPYVFEQ